MKLIMSFLGTFNVTVDGKPARFATARARALLAYLAVEAGRSHRREALAALLWPDHPEELARQNLSQDLARLRRAIEDAGGHYLQVTATAVQFNPANAEVDIAQFQSLLAACSDHRHIDLQRCSACIDRLRSAVNLYHGDFLQGFSLKDNQPFNEWSLYQRERLHRQALDALEILVRHALGAADYTQAQRYAQRQVQLEPWSEEGHRYLMRALAAQGQRSAALAQYETCQRVLAAELGVKPSAETLALYEHLRDAKESVQPQYRPLSALPAPLTPFVGRALELAEISAQLAETGVRLLTLVGLGGMGKTRLAIEAARAHAGACPDGVYFVSLVPQSAPITLASAIAAALGVTLQNVDGWTEALRMLRQRRALLILDGFENLMAPPQQRASEGSDAGEQGASRALVELLEAAPGVQVIATSRVRLGISGEYVYVVDGLEYPLKAGVEEAAAAPAVRLLVESARRRIPRFTLTASKVDAVLRICALVRGMPLGIELAAAWFELLTPEEVAAEIAKSVDFLADEHSDVPSRQRSLRAVFDWSWRRLSESERQALQRLSVFQGGFTREAAQAIIGVSLRDLTSLVYKSLLRWNWTQGAGGYDLHEVVRQFAAEQLSRFPSEREAVEARHATFYLELLGGFETRVDSLDAPAAIRELQAEAVHIGPAWAWAVAHGDLDRVNRTLYSLWQFYFITGRWGEAERAFRQAVERLRDGERNLGSTAAPTAANAPILSKLLAIHAYTLHLRSQSERALAVAQEAIALALESGAMDGLSAAEMLCGIVLALTGSPLDARPHVERALALCLEHHQDYPGEMLRDVWWSCEHLMTQICLTLGDLAEAERHIYCALQLCQGWGKRRGELGCLYFLGERAFHARDYRKACEYYEQMLALALNIDDLGTLGMLAQLRLAETRRMQGDYGQAWNLLARALANLGEIGSIYELRALACLGRLELYLGDAHSAGQRLAQLAAAIDPAPPADVKSFALLTQALLALQRRVPERALAHATALRQLQQASGNPYEGAATLIVMGHAAAAAARWAEAQAAYAQAVSLAETFNIRDLAAEGHAGLANVAICTQDIATALAHAEEILALLAEQPRVGLDEPFITYLACYRVLAATEDARARDVLAQGHARLIAYADRIEDEALRQSFLENVAEHRELRQLYLQHNPSQGPGVHIGIQ